MRGGGADTGGRRGRKEGRLAGAQPARKGAVQVTADPPTEADYHEVSQTFSDNACVLTCVGPFGTPRTTTKTVLSNFPNSLFPVQGFPLFIKS